jgi:hypothetical protein
MFLKCFLISEFLFHCCESLFYIKSMKITFYHDGMKRIRTVKFIPLGFFKVPFKVKFFSPISPGVECTFQ